MARYIDAETALKIIDNYAKTVTADGIVVVKAIRDIVEIITPTADVVPKSEVESIITLNSQLEAKVFDTRKEADILKSIIIHKEEEAYNKGFNDALKDVEEMITKNVSERGK